MHEARPLSRTVINAVRALSPRRQRQCDDFASSVWPPDRRLRKLAVALLAPVVVCHCNGCLLVVVRYVAHYTLLRTGWRVPGAE